MMRRSHSPLVPRVLAFAATLACSLAAGAADLTLALSRNPGSLPIFVAQARGFFADEGLTVRVLPCAIGKECLRMVLDGKAQIGTVADLPIALTGFGNQGMSLIATINTNRNDTKIIVRRSSGIAKVGDLAGRTVGTYMGTTAHYSLDSQFLLHGVDSGKVKWTNLRIGDERTSLQAGKVEAMALFEPFAYEAMQTLGKDALQLDTLRVYSQTWNLVTAAPPARPPDTALAALLRALDRACQVIKKDPDYAKGLLREHTPLSAELISKSWPTLEYDVVLKQALLATFEGQARWALRMGMAQGEMPNYLRLIHSLPLRSALPDNVTLAE